MKNISKLGLSACLSLSLSLSLVGSTASAQDIVTAPARTPTCNSTWRTIEAAMNSEGTVTFTVPSDEQLLQLQQRCHRGELRISSAYDHWLRQTTGTTPNAPVETLDMLNMLQARSERVICDEHWGASTVGTGNRRHCECGEGRIMVRIEGARGHRVGCAAGPGFAQDYVTRSMLETELGTICGGAPEGAIHDRCVAFRAEFDGHTTSLTNLQDGLTTLRDDVTAIRHDVGAVTTVYCPPIAGNDAATMEERCRAARATLATGSDVTAATVPVARRVGNVEAVVNRRGWRGGGQLSLLIPTGDAAPYVSFGPSLGHVWGHVSDDGAVWLAHGSVGVTGAPNVGGGAAADGAVGVGYHVGPVSLAGTLLGGAMWTPVTDPRFHGSNLSWYAGAGVEVQVDLAERLRLRGSFGVAGGQTTQVNDAGLAGRVGGPYLPVSLALEGTF